VVQSLDPAGVGARDLRECLLLQLESRNGRGGVAWQIVFSHLKLLETRQFRELARVLGRPPEHIEIAVSVIRHLNGRPGLRFSGAGARLIEPDVYFTKDGEDYIIQMNDEDLPQLRLNAQYRRLLDRDSNGSPKEVRNYIKERYTSAIQLMKNIEQRKQTILKVCEAIGAAARRLPDAWHRSTEAHDDQRGGRGSGRPPIHGEPRRGQQVRSHAAGRVRTALFSSPRPCKAPWGAPRRC